MAHVPKLAPCPKCKTDENLAIFTYENGWRHVECNGCWALGPGEGSQRQAALSWNKRALEAALTQATGAKS